MATKAKPELLAEVHVAGPVEKEIRGSGRVRIVQRCLRCDVAVIYAGPFYEVGTRVASAPSGGQMKRYVVGERELRDGEEPCRPVPFVAL